jgi:hypothetical protein
MNDKEIDDKEVKESLIKFRDMLEEYTQMERQKFESPAGLYSLFFKYIS